MHSLKHLNRHRSGYKVEAIFCRLKTISLLWISCFFLLASCTTVPIQTHYSQLTKIKKIIQKAKDSQAERCAPKHLASAVALFYWAAHELDENGAHAAETNALLRKAERHAKIAEQEAFLACSGLKTTIILLPDEDGKVGAVIVKTKNKELLINKAYHYSSVIREKDTLTPMAKGNKPKIDKNFAKMLKAQPLKPAHFTLFFKTGTSQLTLASKNSLATILPALKKRIPAVINIDGHTDTVASDNLNMALSKQRAQTIAKYLRHLGIKIRRIHIKYYGEKKLATSTQDNTDEARNRRVELMIY